MGHNIFEAQHERLSDDPLVYSRNVEPGDYVDTEAYFVDFDGLRDFCLTLDIAPSVYVEGDKLMVMLHGDHDTIVDDLIDGGGFSHAILMPRSKE